MRLRKSDLWWRILKVSEFWWYRGSDVSYVLCNTVTGFRYRAIPCEGRLNVLSFRASPIINWVIFRVRGSMP